MKTLTYVLTRGRETKIGVDRSWKGMAAVLQDIVYPHELNAGGNDLIGILERGCAMNVEYDPGI